MVGADLAVVHPYIALAGDIGSSGLIIPAVALAGHHWALNNCVFEIRSFSNDNIFNMIYRNTFFSNSFTPFNYQFRYILKTFHKPKTDVILWSRIPIHLKCWKIRLQNSNLMFLSSENC